MNTRQKEIKKVFRGIINTYYGVNDDMSIYNIRHYDFKVIAALSRYVTTPKTKDHDLLSPMDRRAILSTLTSHKKRGCNYEFTFNSVREAYTSFMSGIRPKSVLKFQGEVI